MGNEAKIKVGGIMAASGLATVSILSLPDRPDVPGMILHAMGGRNINIEFVVHNVDIEGNGNMTFCIDQKNLETALEVLEGVKPLIEARGISYHPNVATVSVFGPHFRGEADDLRSDVQCPGDRRDQCDGDQHLDLQLLLCD